MNNGVLIMNNDALIFIFGEETESHSDVAEECRCNDCNFYDECHCEEDYENEDYGIPNDDEQNADAIGKYIEERAATMLKKSEIKVAKALDNYYVASFILPNGYVITEMYSVFDNWKDVCNRVYREIMSLELYALLQENDKVDLGNEHVQEEEQSYPDDMSWLEYI